jgi:hypothetical protein
MNPDAGVNVAVAPDTCQLPAIFGEMDGSGVLGDNGAENVSVMGAPPLASLAPPPGVADSRWRDGTAFGAGADADADVDADVDVDVTGFVSPALVSVSWPDECAAANAQPATITAVAVPAVAATIRCRSSAAPTRPAPPKLPKNDKSISSADG